MFPSLESRYWRAVQRVMKNVMQNYALSAWRVQNNLHTSWIEQITLLRDPISVDWLPLMSLMSVIPWFLPKLLQCVTDRRVHSLWIMHCFRSFNKSGLFSGPSTIEMQLFFWQLGTEALNVNQNEIRPINCWYFPIPNRLRQHPVAVLPLFTHKMSVSCL